MTIHIPTLFAVMIAVNVIFALIVGLMVQRRYPSMAIWSLALLMQTVAYVLLALRGYLPDPLSIIGGNAALAGTLSLYLVGVLAFRHITWPPALVWAPVLVATLAATWWLDDIQTRGLWVSAVYAWQCLLIIAALCMRRTTPLQTGERLIIVGAGINVLVMLYRMWAFDSGQITALFDGHYGWLHSVPFLFMLATTTFMTLGLITMYQQRTEASLQTSKKHHALRNEVLEMLAQGQPLKNVLHAMVRGIETMHPHLICSVLLLDRHGRHLLTGAAPSLPAHYNAAVQAQPTGPGVGSCGEAAHTGQRVVVPNIETHPSWAPYLELTRPLGLRACWSQPIYNSQRKVVGTFGTYLRQARAPYPAELEWVESWSVLAGIVIEHSTAASELRERENQYRLLIETANDGIAVLQDGLLRFGNPRLFQMLGYPPQDTLDRPFATWLHEDDRARALEQHQARLEDHPVASHQTYRVMTAHQGWRWFEVRGATFTWQGQPATLSMMTDVTERRDMQARIENQALHDSLTDLPNRRLLMHNLHLAMAAHRRNGLLGAVIFLDLDNFKPLNDRHGHRVGDLLLLEVAQRLRLNVRETDTVSRFGGDEFVVLLSDLQADEAASQAQALAIAEKLRAALGEPYRLNASTGPQHPRMVEHRCTASVGVVLFNGTQPDDMEDVLKRADMAMYQAKHAGRNSVYLAQ